MLEEKRELRRKERKNAVYRGMSCLDSRSINQSILIRNVEEN